MKYVAITLTVVLSAWLPLFTSCSRPMSPERPEISGNPDNRDNTDTPDTPQEEPTEPADGASIIGKVITRSGEPIPGVAVSDGLTVTLTDSEGNYRLGSDKSCGYVFISVPGNYSPETNGSTPMIHQALTEPAGTQENHIFYLHKTDNSRHVVLFQTDQHLANRTEDLKQAASSVLTDINSTVNDYRNAGYNVYSVSLGDLSWDQFWRANNFNLVNARDCLDNINCPVFHTIGNHDNDAWISDDWEASHVFRKNIAPVYYSFNIGDVHYVVLDNVLYKNPGATDSQIGDRSYDVSLTPRQREWLRNDLALVADKSAPLVICAHCPLYSEPALNGQNVTTKPRMKDAVEFDNIIAGFSDITVFTGDFHRNFSVSAPSRLGLTQHSIAAISGTLWWTGKGGYAGRGICVDGSPSGYGILEIVGRDLKYSYKSIGHERDYQFRVYDLNTVIIDRKLLTNTTHVDKLAEYSDAYGKQNNGNELLINVFAWGPGWKIEVSENGNDLPVSRVSAKDPLHIISYELQRLNHGAIPTENLVTRNCNHIFKSRASKPDTEITVKVTDNHGQVYSQTVERPKKFSISMK